MARHRKFSQLPYIEQIRYCRNRLADPNLHPIDRDVITKRLNDLGVRCAKCGRAIENPSNRKAWERDFLGPECREKTYRLTEDESLDSYRDDLHDVGAA